MLGRFYSTETPVQTAVGTPFRKQPVQSQDSEEYQSFEELRVAAQERFRKAEIRSTLEQIPFRRSEDQPTDLTRTTTAQPWCCH